MQVRTIKRTILQELIAEIRISGEYMKSNLASLIELRTSFLLLAAGMMINNISLLVVWVLFFQAFGSINGWNRNEVIGLQGFIATVYGLSFTFCTGSLRLPTTINNGSFDSLMLTPRSLYFRILTLTTQAASVGDTIYGLIVLVIYFVIIHASIWQALLLISLVIPATLIMVNFALLTSCIGFLIPDSDELSKNTFDIMFGPSLYPAGVFQGGVRFIFLFILPTIAIAGLPVEAAKNLNLTSVLIVWALAIFWTLVALWALKQGVKRYESGNLTGARI